MFADPQSVTVNAVAQSLPRISDPSAGNQSSTYRKDDQAYALVISHAEGNRNRRSVRLNAKIVAADPLTAVNTEYTMSCYLVIDVPPVGFTNTQVKDNVLGLTGWLTSANILKVLGGES